MEAIIVKNDEFKTIGLFIYSKGRTKDEGTIKLFSWGISPDFYYSKNITIQHESKGKVKRLVEIKEAIKCYEQFRWDIFEILNQQDRKMLKKGEGLKLQLIDDKIKELETEMENIIMEFK